jgi:hypothetical protein
VKSLTTGDNREDEDMLTLIELLATVRRWIGFVLLLLSSPILLTVMLGRGQDAVFAHIERRADIGNHGRNRSLVHRVHPDGPKPGITECNPRTP